MELISLLIGVAGFLFGLFMYVKNRSSQEMTVIYANQLLEAKSGQGVEMLYLGEPVTHLIRYDMTVFNSGSKGIRLGDFKSGLTLGFDNLGIVSQTAGFSSEGVKPEYTTDSDAIGIDFEFMKPNDHMTFEVLAGGLSGDLPPPICDSRLSNDKSVKIHQQAFDEETRNSKYDGLVKHLGVALVALCAGVVLFGIAFFSKYQAYFAGKELAFREQLAVLLSVDSLPWFLLFIVSMILLLFAYESAKVIAPKFRRYKFEQLIQNRE
ncbi:MAG: hypothetical protein ACPG47_10500 [Leucothrix sp.]